MKKILLLILITTSYLSAQDVRFSANIYTQPQHYSKAIWSKANGFNIGAGIEYQMSLMYFDVDFYLFPNLNNVSYTHIQSTVFGINYHNRFRDVRIKLGIFKPGLIKRGKFTYPMAGSDFGVEYYFKRSFYVGIEVSGDWRTDDKYWSPEAKGYYQVSSGIKIGIHW